MTDENQNVDTAENQQAPDNVVTLIDLQNVLVILDLASSRGAFRGPELQPIGQLYDKINRFLQVALPRREETDGNEATPEGEA